MPRPEGLKSPRQGQAAVLRVASELMFRNIAVAFPACDDSGVDLIALPNVRIQVKSTYLRHNHRVYPQGAYWFSFRRAPIVSGNHKIVVRGTRKFSEFCEFVILVGIDQGRFWIVPAAKLDHKSLVCVGPDATASEVPRSVTTGRFALAKEVRECEGRWDFITDTLAARQ